MGVDKPEYYSLGQIMTRVLSFLRYAFRKWVWMLLFIIIGAGIGYVIYIIQKPKYEAVCTFILEEKQSGLGGLGGIASQFGIDVGGLTGGGGMFAGDNILDILTSKQILNKVLLSKADSSVNQKTLADIYLDFSGLRSKWSGNLKLSAISFEQINGIADMNILQDSVLNIVYDDVLKKHLSVERINKKGTIFKTNVVSISPDFSKLLVQRLVYGSKDFYVSVKTSVINANVTRLQRKADSLALLLTSSSYRAAHAQVNDPNPALRSLQVPTELAVRDKTVLATLYSEVVKNLEVARTTLMLQTPVLEILDFPSLSVYDNKKGKLFFMIIGAFVAATFYTVILLLRFLGKKRIS